MTMRSKLTTCWIMSLLLLPLSMVSAGGAPSTSSSSDPEGDVSSRLDIVHVSASLVRRGIKLKVVTAESWPCGYIEYEPSIGTDASKARLYWEIDGDRDGEYDIAGHYFCDRAERAVKFEIYGSERDTLSARRPNGRTVISILKPSRYPELDGPEALLRVVSTADGYDGGTQIMVSETDRAPDNGDLRLRLRQ